MSKKNTKFPCPSCGNSNKTYLRSERGRAGIAGSRWFRATFTCKSCRLKIQGVRPGQVEQLVQKEPQS